MDLERIKKLSGQEQEDKGILTEAISKLIRNSFDADTQIFPIELRVRADFGSRDGTVTLVLSSVNDRSVTGDLRNLTAVASRRLAALNRSMKLGGKGETRGFVAVRFRDQSFGSASDPKEVEKSGPFRLAQAIAKKLKMKSRKLSMAGPQEIGFIKEYDDLDELARDLDKISK